MGLSVINPKKYGKLCEAVIPKVIENDEEFDRLVEQMEALDRHERPTPEQEVLSALLMTLIQDYDDRHHPLPELPPHKMVQFLMEKRGLRQVDMVAVFGSRSVASEVISGRREPSKMHIRKLVEFFQLPADVFL